MELDWLDDFMALAASKSFSRAAEVRHITQPAFSRRIQMLETWVGTPLFLRLPRQITLTSAGEKFKPCAEALIADLRKARVDARDAAGRGDKTLSIASTHALSFTFFPRWLREQAPKALLYTINLRSDSMQACEELMLRGEVSFLLCHHHAEADSKLNTRQFRQQHVGEDMLIPVSAPDSSGSPRWQLKTDVSAPALPHLSYAPQSGLGRILTADWKSRGLSFNLVPAMTASGATALLTMAEDGCGIAWLPRSLVIESLAAGTLVDAGHGQFNTPVQIILCRPAARQSQTAEIFWSSITA